MKTQFWWENFLKNGYLEPQTGDGRMTLTLFVWGFVVGMAEVQLRMSHIQY
jgi:hypothetical protein